ncbi:MAG: dihydroxy-acid dehydratase, partial [Fimbriimonadaceae bacterium]
MFDPRHKSRTVTEGPQRAPHRSYFRAMGLGDEHMERPWVGVATVWNEATPCNLTLHDQGRQVCSALDELHATPRQFNTISVSDGIAMGHQGMKTSLVSREVIADSTELMVRAHCYDGLVGIAGCDKSLPGLLMAMARLDIPSVFVYGGTIMPGELDGKEITVQDVFEAVGQHSAGTIDDERLKAVECAACPGAGSCGGQYTANTMACVSEALGMALPGSTSPPAVAKDR